ncbi:MAG TPA: 2OG-Fe(II) oxygenase family protein [Alphaproteobacteria bacterium]|nr:2OG-Fe(II) oxygenase family protein [Alphaproteobacteria bacterium]
MQVFDYSSLSSQKNQIVQAFYDRGIIAIQGVPGYVKAYADFIESSRSFINLTEETRAQYTPRDAYGRGWSYGIETFNGVTDAFKGSYYATYPEEDAILPNIWPCQDVPGFKQNYLNLVEIIFRTGKEIQSLLGINIKDVLSVSRMLYYGPVHDSGEVEWCGEHRDHGLLTGLCPGVCFLKGERIPKPPGTGLFIRGEEIFAPGDALLFQIGEVAELITNGAVTATEHEVRKAVGGCERYGFAHFIAPKSNYAMESVLSKYNDRFSQGLSYGEWHNRSYAKYNEIP